MPFDLGRVAEMKVDGERFGSCLRHVQHPIAARCGSEHFAGFGHTELDFSGNYRGGTFLASSQQHGIDRAQPMVRFVVGRDRARRGCPGTREVAAHQPHHR